LIVDVTSVMAPSVAVVRDPIASDYRRILRSAFAASAVALVSKLGAIVFFAQEYGASWGIRTWHGIPYLGFSTDQVTFAGITTRSTIVLSIVVPITIAVAVIRHRSDHQRMGGWLTAPLSLIYTIAVDVLLHRWRGSYVTPGLHKWSFLGLIASLAFVAAWMLAERPWRQLDRLSSHHTTNPTTGAVAP
jgi:hypothetical protein